MKRLTVVFAVAIILLPFKVKAGELDSYVNYNENHYAYAKRIKAPIYIY